MTIMKQFGPLLEPTHERTYIISNFWDRSLQGLLGSNVGQANADQSSPSLGSLRKAVPCYKLQSQTWPKIRHWKWTRITAIWARRAIFTLWSEKLDWISWLNADLQFIHSAEPFPFLSFPWHVPSEIMSITKDLRWIQADYIHLQKSRSQKCTCTLIFSRCYWATNLFN